MRFTASQITGLIFGAIAVHAAVIPSSSAVEKRDPQCLFPFSTPDYIWDIAGNPVCLTKWDQGKRIVGLAFWYGPEPQVVHAGYAQQSALGRLEVRYDDGTTDVVGRHTADGLNSAGAVGFSLQGEIITDLQIGPRGMWKGGLNKDQVGAASGTDAGTIWFKTNKKEATISPYDGQYKQDLKKQDVQGGTLTGVTAYADGDYVHSLNFHFTPGQLKSMTYGKMHFDPAVLDSLPVEVTAVGGVTDCNPVNNTNVFHFKNTQSVQTTVTNSHSHSNTYGFEISESISLSVPLIATSTASATFKFSHEDTNIDTYADQKTTSLEWSKDWTEPANSITECAVTVGHFSGSIPYNTDITLLFDDGSEHSYPTTGVLDSNIFTMSGTSVCISRPIDPNSDTDRAKCSIKQS